MEQKHISELTNKEMIQLLRLIKNDLVRFCKILSEERNYVNNENEFDNDQKDFYIKNSLQKSKWIGNIVLNHLYFYDEHVSPAMNENIKQLIQEDIKWADKAVDHTKEIRGTTQIIFEYKGK